MKMKRREVITLLGGAAAAWPALANAQQTAKPPTIGYLGPNSRLLDGQRLSAFVQRLRELGWIEDRTITIEYRWADGRNEHLADIAADFVRRKVDVIVTSATPPTVAAKQATSVIPIVFAAVGDPVGSGDPPLGRNFFTPEETTPACSCPCRSGKKPNHRCSALIVLFIHGQAVS